MVNKILLLYLRIVSSSVTRIKEKKLMKSLSNNFNTLLKLFSVMVPFISQSMTSFCIHEYLMKNNICDKQSSSKSVPVFISSSFMFSTSVHSYLRSPCKNKPLCFITISYPPLFASSKCLLIFSVICQKQCKESLYLFPC